MASSKTRIYQCPRCSASFNPARKEQVCCSRVCSSKSYNENNKLGKDFKCSICDSKFYRKLSEIGKCIAKGIEPKYCSYQCKGIGGHQNMLEGLKQWRGSEEYRQRIEERKAALQKIKDDAKRIKTEKINAKALTHDLIGIIGMFRKCIVCDACMGHMALTQRSARHCSDECKNAVAKARRRSHKQRYRAKLKLARVERVIDISVFKRDNWLCYICGCHCPSDLAGTNHPRAPTIDHLIPISKGGEHSMRNIKLACRECNSLKSDRIIV